MLKRLGAIAGISAAVIVVIALPASADDGYGFTDCTQVPNPGCELGAGTGGGSGGGGQGNGNPAPPRPGHGNPGNGPQEDNGDTILGGDPALAQCMYELSDYQGPPPGGAQPAAFLVPANPGVTAVVPASYQRQRQLRAQPPSGAWYVYKCSGPGLQDALYRPPVWIPGGQPGPAPLPSPAELAAMTRNQLRLPVPRINANPAGDQLVSLPTWLWLTTDSWGDISATASVPGVSVTAVARPTSVAWTMGDGGSVTCDGPGTVFPASGDPKSASPDCGYIYRTSSAGQQADAFAVTAAVSWTVTWSGAGQGGTFPNMTTSATTTMRVAESQGIATG